MKTSWLWSQRVFGRIHHKAIRKVRVARLMRRMAEQAQDCPICGGTAVHGKCTSPARHE